MLVINKYAGKKLCFCSFNLSFDRLVNFKGNRLLNFKGNSLLNEKKNHLSFFFNSLSSSTFLENKKCRQEVYVYKDFLKHTNSKLASKVAYSSIFPKKCAMFLAA